MKTNLKVCAMAFTASMLIGGVFSACTSEETDGFLLSGKGISLAKAPDVVAYSGGNYFGNTFANKGIATRASEDSYYERWQSDRSWTKPNDIIEAERDYVLQYLQNHPNGGYKTLDIDEYVIQVVGGGHHSYTGDTSDHNGTWHTIDDATNYMKKCYIDGFFTQYNNGHEMNTEDCILIKNVKATNATYEDSYGTTWENHYAFYFITFPDDEQYGYMAGKTGLYLCYDYATYKANEQWGVTADGIYDDWVIKLSPSNGTFFSEPEEKNGCDCPSNCPDCNGDCEDCQCGNNTPDIQIPDPLDPGFGVTPEDPEVKSPEPEVKHNNEVEVNLSINDELEKGDYVSSHLSIHVRHAGDVEIFLPIKEEYYCEADDMYIIREKYVEEGFTYGDEENRKRVENENKVYRIEYTLGEHTVTLTIKYEAKGIRITTDGITQDIIDYCQENYKDGITFEVWNYYDMNGLKELLEEDEGTVRTKLQGLLNGSTIEFLNGAYPDYYINAFGELKDTGEKTPGDCTVSIKDNENENESIYNKEEGCYHLNGSRYNDVYTWNGVAEEERTHSVKPE